MIVAVYVDSIIQRQVAAGDGLVTRPALVAAGVSPAAIGRRLRLGMLIAVQPGVYRPPATELTPRIMRRAAVLAAGPGAAISHRAAAHEWALTERFDRVVELTVPRPRSPRLRGATVHRSRRLGARDIRWRDGLPVTSVDRTLVDLGAVCPQPIVAEAVETAVIARRTTIDHLYGTVDDLAGSGRRGLSALRLSLDEWLLGDKPPDSALEPMLARALELHGLPPPVLQFEVRVGGRFVARVDFAWPSRMVIVEVDGFHAHATAAALGHDLHRQNELVALGYRVLRFPWPAVVREPAAVAERIAGVLGRAVAA